MTSCAAAPVVTSLLPALCDRGHTLKCPKLRAETRGVTASVARVTAGQCYGFRAVHAKKAWLRMGRKSYSLIRLSTETDDNAAIYSVFPSLFH